MSVISARNGNIQKKVPTEDSGMTESRQFHLVRRPLLATKRLSTTMAKIPRDAPHFLPVSTSGKPHMLNTSGRSKGNRPVVFLKFAIEGPCQGYILSNQYHPALWTKSSIEACACFRGNNGKTPAPRLGALERGASAHPGIAGSKKRWKHAQSSTF